jgi:ATPase subunit of ABC transporter with duplicated ATPase domains
MLSAKQVSLSRGGQTVLNQVSISAPPGSRVGVVGPNGIGKTTLLRVLAGVEMPDEGVLVRSPASLSVGYLTQEPDAASGETLMAYLSRRTGVAAASAALDRLTSELAAAASPGPDPDLVDAYSDALARFVALGGDDFEARTASVCADLGLPPDRFGVQVHALSGGETARAGLAAILLARFDVFLLDEPTNDLDFAGLDRLEGFLTGLTGAVVVVSHDRAFLDRSVSRILELREDSHTSVEYAGGWSDYVEARALARSQQEEAFRQYLDERRRLSEGIRTQRNWSEKGVATARRRPRDHDKAQRGFFRNRTEKQAAKVRASERRLERLAAVDKPWEGWELHLDLTPAGRSGDVVARFSDAVVHRGSFTLGPFALEVGWAERIAILGPNGSGKSSLLEAILGRLPLSSGQRWVGPGVVFGELDQRRAGLGGEGRPVLDRFMAATGLLQEEARSLLAKFGLGADHVMRPPGQLSPGERTRAILAALMAQGVNCLVLDEPTNHLDLAAIEQLEEALDRFEGTLMLVSHDRWLLESVRLTRTVAVQAGGLVLPD